MSDFEPITEVDDGEFQPIETSDDGEFQPFRTSYNTEEFMPFEGRHPIISSAWETTKAMPELVRQGVGKFIHGATIGASSKLARQVESLDPKDAPKNLKEREIYKAKLFADGEWGTIFRMAAADAMRKSPIIGPSVYFGKKAEKDSPVISPLAATLSETAGAFVPISRAGAGIELIVKGVPKYIKPLLRIVGWGAAGGSMDAVEQILEEEKTTLTDIVTGNEKKGFSAKEMAESAGFWAGTEAILSSLGYAGRFALSVNKLAKIWGTSRIETTQIVLKTAKETSFGKVAESIAKHAQSTAQLQAALKKMETGVSDKVAKKLVKQFGTDRAEVIMDAIRKKRDPLAHIKPSEAADQFLTDVEKLVSDSEGRPFLGTSEQLRGKLTTEEAIQEAAARESEGSVPNVFEESLATPGSVARETKPQFNPAKSDIVDLENALPVDLSKAPMIEYKGQQILDFTSLKENKSGFAAEFGRKMTPEQAMSLSDSFSEGIDTLLKNRGTLTPEERMAQGVINKLKAESLESFEEPALKRAMEVRHGIDSTATESTARNLDDIAKANREEIIVRAIARTRTARQVAEAKYDRITEDLLKKKSSEAGSVSLRIPATISGSAYGFEKNDEGNWNYNSIKGVAGMAAMAAGGYGISKLKSRPNVITKLAPKLTGDSKKVMEMYDRTVVARNDLNAFKPSKFKAAMVRAITDVSGNLKKAAMNVDKAIGKKVVMAKELMAGVNARSALLIEGYRKNIFNPLTPDKQELLNRFIQSRRVIAIDKYKPGMAHPEGLGGIENQKFLDDITKADPTLHKEMMDSADKYFSAMNDQLKDLLNNGLITQKSFDNLSKHAYSKREFLKYVDPEIQYTLGGKKISVADSGIKSLTEGDIGLLENNAEKLLQETVVRTQARIAKNKANQSLWELAQIKGNPVVQPAKLIKVTNAGKLIFQPAPAGFDTVSVMIGGQRKEMLMPTGMAKEWISNDPVMNQAMSTTLGWLSGSKIVKPLATGYNPYFILTNIPRDMGLVLTATTEYSMHMPIAGVQMAKDMFTVLPDVLLRKGRVKDYILEGGGMELLTYQGRLTTKGRLNENVGKIAKTLGYLGETSELLTRLALRERAIINDATKEEATWAARRYLDFAQNGNIIKGLDHVIPYLNAGVQGTRSLVRAARENPAIFMYKMAQLGTISSALYMANRSINPEVLDQVSDRDKEANFIITTKWTYKNNKGETKPVVFKVAKDYGHRLACTLFESVFTKVYEGKNPTAQQMMALNDLANLPGIPSFPSLSAILAYAANKDTWTLKDVWTGPNVHPYAEVKETTGQPWEALAKIGLSPERSKAAANKVLPLNNPFVGLMTTGIDAVWGDLSEEIKSKPFTQLLVENPGIRRIMANTNPYIAERDIIEETKLDINTKDYQQRMALDELTNQYLKTKDKEKGKELYSYIKSQPEEDQDKLVKRFIKTVKYADIPDRSWWLTVHGMNPEGRAAVFYDKFSKVSKEKQKQMLMVAGKMDGFVTEKFVQQLKSLKKGK